MNNFDNKDFFEFLWLYERLAKQKNLEHEAEKSNGKSINLQDRLQQMGR